MNTRRFLIAPSVLRMRLSRDLSVNLTYMPLGDLLGLEWNLLRCSNARKNLSMWQLSEVPVIR